MRARKKADLTKNNNVVSRELQGKRLASDEMTDTITLISQGAMPRQALNERTELPEVSKVAAGFRVLLIRSLYGGGIPRR